ncbi:MAG: heat-inducible transcriptional repressor HrcA [Clostridia bacterium]|nr:heat-inducible transcriptional repressor HrcA [Clostridia bacterium]
MFLDDRKRRILQAIIDDYIDTAEPIGSRSIARKHELGLSSATIRNEMADLEEMGYLEQPHTSAGRIPSDKGYRFYVDQLMKMTELSTEEIISIRNAMEVRINELSQLIRQASMIMSKITRYTSLAVPPQLKKSTLKAVQVVPIEPDKVLVIVVINAGVVRNNMVKIPKEVSPDYLINVSNVLNEKLSGHTLEQLNLPFIIKEVESSVGACSELLGPILNSVVECIKQVDNAEVITDGATNIFNYPEFRDLIKAREFLNVLDEKDIICKLLANNYDKKGINILIGNEHGLEEIKECTLITTTYSMGDIVVGSIGIIGPTRMEYSKVISSMNYIRKKINQEINKLIDEKFE